MDDRLAVIGVEDSRSGVGRRTRFGFRDDRIWPMSGCMR